MSNITDYIKCEKTGGRHDIGLRPTSPSSSESYCKDCGIGWSEMVAQARNLLPTDPGTYRGASGSYWEMEGGNWSPHETFAEGDPVWDMPLEKGELKWVPED